MQLNAVSVMRHLVVKLCIKLNYFFLFPRLIECGEYAHCRKWRTTIFTSQEQEFGFQIRKPDVMVFLHTKDGTEYRDHQAIIGKSNF